MNVIRIPRVIVGQSPLVGYTGRVEFRELVRHRFIVQHRDPNGITLHSVSGLIDTPRGCLDMAGPVFSVKVFGEDGELVEQWSALDRKDRLRWLLDP